MYNPGAFIDVEIVSHQLLPLRMRDVSGISSAVVAARCAEFSTATSALAVPSTMRGRQALAVSKPCRSA
ncbi:MAG: hypothetical protein M3120_07075 [Pseudomonadota bacterium]|nr:hypothetical protein [Pseudomonadota bacterium]